MTRQYMSFQPHRIPCDRSSHMFILSIQSHLGSYGVGYSDQVDVEARKG